MPLSRAISYQQAAARSPFQLPFRSIYPWDLSAWRTALRVAGLPGYALLALLLGAILQVADTSGQGAGHASAGAILYVRFPLSLVALLLLLFHPRIVRVKLTDTRFPFLAFGILFAVSVLWSEQPLGTLGKSVEILLANLVFLEVSRAQDALRKVEALRQITLLTVSLVSVCTVAGYVLHLSGFVQQRAGLFTSTTAESPFLSGNGLGYIASALVLVLLAEWQCGRLRTGSAIPQLGFALAIFSLSASRTSFGILALTVLILVYRRSRVFAVLSFVVLGSALVALKQLILNDLQGHQPATDFQTLSGRTVVWAAALRQFGEHPVFGAGGGIGGKTVIARIGDMYLEQMSSLHNGFLEALTGLGLVGLLLGIYMLFQVTWRTWPIWRANPQYSGTYVLIVHAWITTIMSTGVLGWMGYEMAFFLCIVNNVDLVRRESARHRVRSSARLVHSSPALPVGAD